MNRLAESTDLAPAASGCRLLYVDLDGTLIATDMLHESVLRLVRSDPAALLRLPAWLARGKAHLKQQIAARTEIDVTTLPYRQPVLDLIAQARQAGARVVLATASDRKFADAVASHLGVFDGVLASGGTVNFGGRDKLAAMEADAAGVPFWYAGDRPVDEAVWRGSAGAVVVSRSAALARRAAALTRVEATVVPPAPGLGRYLYGVRLHQWLKNVLVFVPLLPVLQMVSLTVFGQALVAFLAFGLMASCVYVFNDLLDLESDRRHSRKRKRPFASGEIPIKTGIAMAGGLFAASVILCAAVLPWPFLVVLGLYLFLTSAYSVVLKRRAVVDVFALAALYTLRIIAGAAATGLALSFWILSFSLFLFLSLALAKRYVELAGAANEGKDLADRGYLTADLPYVLCSGIAAAQVSVLVLSLYLNDRDILVRYPHPHYLWVLVPMLLFWVSRVWFKAVRGILHDDPVVFAARDWLSRIIAVVALAAFWAAS